jgi:hypothetical protein
MAKATTATTSTTTAAITTTTTTATTHHMFVANIINGNCANIYVEQASPTHGLNSASNPGISEILPLHNSHPMSEILQASHSHLKEGVETLEIAVTF